jgi:hypothetical protein
MQRSETPRQRLSGSAVPPVYSTVAPYSIGCAAPFGGGFSHCTAPGELQRRMGNTNTG